MRMAFLVRRFLVASDEAEVVAGRSYSQQRQG